MRLRKDLALGFSVLVVILALVNFQSVTAQDFPPGCRQGSFVGIDVFSDPGASTLIDNLTLVTNQTVYYQASLNPGLNSCAISNGFFVVITPDRVNHVVGVFGTGDSIPLTCGQSPCDTFVLSQTVPYTVRAQDIVPCDLNSLVEVSAVTAGANVTNTTFLCGSCSGFFPFEICNPVSGPCLQVTKLVACQPADGQCTNAAYSGFAKGVQSGSQLPAFCYSITITNCGADPLTITNIEDSEFGDITGLFTNSSGPLVGATLGTNGTSPAPSSATIYFATELDGDTTNTVTVLAVEQILANGVEATASATAQVVQAGISCTKCATSPDNTGTSPCEVLLCSDGLIHTVNYSITVTNTGSVGLEDVVVSDSAANCTLPSGFSLPTGASTNFSCSMSLNCTDISSNGLENVVTVVASVSTNESVCVLNSNGVPITVSSACSALVLCASPPACNINGPNAVCAGSTNTYSSSATTGATHSWSISGNGTIVGSTSGGSVTVAAGATGSFSLTDNMTLAGCPGQCNLTVPINNASNGALSCTAIVTSPDDLDGVPNDGNVSLPSNYTWHQVAFGAVISSGLVDLTNVNIVANTQWSQCQATVAFLAANTSTNVNLCSQLVSCDYQGEIFTNLTTVSAQVAQGICGMSTGGTITSQCASYIQCLYCPACTIQGPSYVCANNSNQTYTVTSSLPGASIQWSVVNDAVIVGPSTGSSIVVTPNGNPPIQYDVFASVAINGCTNTCKEWVGVSPAPSCAITPSSITANPGDTVSFTVAPAVGPGVPTITWTGPNGFTSNSLTITINDVGPANAGTYTVAFLDANGCSTVCQASLSVNSGPTPEVITRTKDYWKAHATSDNGSSLTLLKAIQANGGKLDLGFVCLPTGDVNGDGQVDSQDALRQALGLLWGPHSGNSLCAVRKQFAVQMITAIANNAVFSTAKGASLIARARAVAACGDTSAIQAATAELSAFNLSGNSTNLPNGLKESTANAKGARKLQAAIPSSFCSGLTYCGTGHACP